MNLNVIGAIFRRNFTSYFSTPTGYLFICGFVLLIAFAAFWPNEFFNANLANLDQLNKYLPLIMLVFIPAITMAIWAEERRQGTDELLLTIPAADADVVSGKYLAAVAIFTVALGFSAVANWLVFVLLLGWPDPGLYLSTYFGYWMMGLAMLAIGMVASFLTNNLTVAYILGAAFNSPLAFASSADVILSHKWAPLVREWGLGEKFRDFGQGVLSLAGLSYFLVIVAAMLYLSMVLIGRRHWLGGRDGTAMLAHYVLRVVSLAGLAVGLALLFDRAPILGQARVDVTAAQLNSLSPETVKLLGSLDPKRPVVIDAYISPEVPEAYAETRVNLVNMLREFDARGGDKVRVQLHQTEPLSDEADNAEQQFGIQGRRVMSRVRGALKEEDIFLGLAFTSPASLDKVVVPFVDRGVPVEYELIRSIATIARKERKTVGVLATDVQLYGGFNQQTMGMTQNEMIIDELEKQYEVKQVRADAPITEKFDVLLAVQPSSLGPEQMKHFIDAVKSGQPTAIFEDPFPYLDPSVPGTAAPKQPHGGMMMMQQPPQPKGEIQPLWNLLGVEFKGAEVVWQDYNPYPVLGDLPPEFVFAGIGSGAAEPFNPEVAATSGLQQVLFLFPGAVRRREASDLKFTPLVQTGSETGTVKASDVLQMSLFGPSRGLNPNRRWLPTHDSYVLAARVTGKLPKDLPMAGDEAKTADPAAADKPLARTWEQQKEPELNVVVVADIDLLYSAFFNLRNQGASEDADVNVLVDNVSFVLNTLDLLAGDPSFIPVRNKRPMHNTLTVFEQSTLAARNKVNRAREQFITEFTKQREKEEQQLQDEIKKLEQKKGLDQVELLQRVAIAQQAGQKRLEATIERLERDRDEKIKESEREYADEVRSKQNTVKFAAVFWPPILPMLIGLVVFFNRRAREREGVSKHRLRQ